MATQNLLELNRAVLHGASEGKIIFQPRILCWIADRKFLNEPLPGGLDGLTDAQIYRNLGCSNRIYEYNACFVQVLPDSVRTHTRRLSPPGGGDRRGDAGGQAHDDTAGQHIQPRLVL